MDKIETLYSKRHNFNALALAATVYDQQSQLFINIFGLVEKFPITKHMSPSVNEV